MGTLIKSGGGSVLGVDISSSTIKVVQIRKKGGSAVLETYGELSLGPYAGVEPGKATQLDTDVMARALRDLMKESKVSTNRCGIAIPLSSSLINVIQMPDVGEGRLHEMIPMEMRKYVPVNVSEVMFDWRIIPKNELDNDGVLQDQEGDDSKKKMSKVDVLVVAIHKDTIQRYQTIVKEAGLDASFFEIEVFSTARSVLDGAAPVSMIVDMGAGATKVYILEHRILRESHSINRGSQDITLAISKAMGISDEKAHELKHVYGLLKDVGDANVSEIVSLVLDGVFAEVARVMRNYQNRHQKNIGTVILSGGGARLKGIDSKVADILENTVTIADPFSKILTPAFLEDVLRRMGPEFAVSVGVALRKLDEVN